MYLYQTDNNWLQEYCPLCGSLNHIFIPAEINNADAWECWGCFNRWWLDDLAHTMCSLDNNIDENEADDWLSNANPSIIFVYGQSER